MDFGCGSGAHTRLLKEKGAKQIVGYSFSDEILGHDLAEDIHDYARQCEIHDPKDLLLPIRHWTKEIIGTTLQQSDFKNAK